MVPTTRSLPPHHDSSGKNSKPLSYYDPGYYIAAQLEAAQGADIKQQPSRFPRRLAMADEDNVVGRRRPRSQREEEAAGTSSRGGGRGDDEDAGGDKDWLRLGLGAMASSSSSSSAGGDNDAAKALAPPAALDLFSSGKQSASRMSQPSLFPLPIRSYPSQSQYGHDRYRPTTAASGYMTPVPPFLPFARPLRSCSSDLLMRVVSPPPPRTEAAGLWLTLQAAPNQVREPILPQIPKSYLRIRDSNMKVEVVLKYLADKLGLTQSQQLELTCRGHLLPPFLLMKHVRDSIWCGSPAAMEDEAALAGTIPPRRSPGDAATTTDHVMTLFYSTARNH